MLPCYEIFRWSLHVLVHSCIRRPNFSIQRTYHESTTRGGSLRRLHLHKTIPLDVPSSCQHQRQYHSSVGTKSLQTAPDRSTEPPRRTLTGPSGDPRPRPSGGFRQTRRARHRCGGAKLASRRTRYEASSADCMILAPPLPTPYPQVGWLPHHPSPRTGPFSSAPETLPVVILGRSYKVPALFVRWGQFCTNRTSSGDSLGQHLPHRLSALSLPDPRASIDTP